MNNYDISIIVSCYNCAKFVKKTIKSVLRQSYDFNRIELILINDGSTDNTLSVIKKYESDNVVIIDKKNEGVSATRNLGIKKARGRYLLFLDSDDYLSSDAVKNLIEFFDLHYDEVDLVTYPIVMFYPSGRKVLHSRYKNSKFDKGTGIYDLDKYYYLVQSTINVMIKNDKKVFFDTNQSYSEDEFFNTNIVMEKKKIGYVKDAIYYYRKHSKSITAKKKSFDLEKIYKFHDDLLLKYNNHPYIQSIIVNNFRWRINEECVFPDSNQINDIQLYVDNIRKRLKNIDFSLFINNKIEFEEDSFLYLLTLSGQDFEVKNNSLIQQNKTIINNIVSNNYIYMIKFNNSISIYGKLNTALYYSTDEVSLYACFTDEVGNTNLSLVNLLCDDMYDKNYSRKYVLKVDSNVKKVSFILKKGKEEVKVITKAVDWCSESKIYSDYQIVIDNDIWIRKKKITDVLRNKISKTKSVKFKLINFLSLFEKKHKIYFGDKDSKLYKLYEFDRDRSKVFIDRPVGFKYKLMVLSAKKIITDKSFKEVFPFGKMTKYYISSSDFAVDYKVGEEHEN